MNGVVDHFLCTCAERADKLTKLEKKRDFHKDLWGLTSMESSAAMSPYEQLWVIDHMGLVYVHTYISMHVVGKHFGIGFHSDTMLELVRKEKLWQMFGCLECLSWSAPWGCCETAVAPECPQPHCDLVFLALELDLGLSCALWISEGNRPPTGMPRVWGADMR